MRLDVIGRNFFRVLLAVGLVFAVQACSSDDDDEDDENFELRGAGSGANLAQDPAIAKINLFAFAVSESEYCTDPVVVIDNGDTPVEFDMLENPEIPRDARVWIGPALMQLTRTPCGPRS